MARAGGGRRADGVDAQLLSELAPLVNAHQGLIYQLADDSLFLQNRIDGTGCLLTPGLVNTHHHLYQWATRGLALDETLVCGDVSNPSPNARALRRWMRVCNAVNAIDPDLALGVVRTLDDLRDRRLY